MHRDIAYSFTMGVTIASFWIFRNNTSFWLTFAATMLAPTLFESKRNPCDEYDKSAELQLEKELTNY